VPFEQLFQLYLLIPDMPMIQQGDIGIERLAQERQDQQAPGQKPQTAGHSFENHLGFPPRK
jgi:hypothetical protein